jgi:secernin
MCDTFVYRSDCLDSRQKVWFGKNSDREPNEAHEVVFHKGRKYPSSETIKCTYIEVPQAKLTYDVILCKPAWMWGAEMGVNSQGVVIGNEALFTKGGASREPALTGMDLLRLALERSENATAARDCIIELLEKFGQGGNCGFSHPFFYNNSFLVADRNETWVLETIHREWAAKKYVTSTAISNRLTIRADWDMASQGFKSLNDLAGEMSDRLFTTFSQAKIRRECVLDSVKTISPDADISASFKVLRSHHGSDEIPANSLTANTVCMHAGFGPIRLDQTTGSLVVDLSSDEIAIWITGTSAPCLSVFHPGRISDFTEDTVLSSENDWRGNEIFHRNAIFCSKEFIDSFREERDRLEKEFVDQPEGNWLNNMSRKMEFLSGWKKRAVDEVKRPGLFIFRNAWKTFNKQADLKINL